jgi:hypothetical protein
MAVGFDRSKGRCLCVKQGKDKATAIKRDPFPLMETDYKRLA